MHHLRLEHAITAAVALSLTGLALAEGGFAPTAYAATAALVWGAVVIGLATGALPRSTIPAAAIVAGMMIGGFAALTGLSMTWAADNGSAFEDVVRALAYVGVFVLVVVASRRAGAGAWLRGLAIGLAALAALALLARFEPGLFGNPDAELREVLPAAAGRLTYPIGYWNGLAAAMATAIVLLAWIAAAGSRRLGRTLAVAALPAAVLALWATDSRGGIVAAGLAFAVLVAFGPRRLALIVNAGFGIGAGIVLAALASSRDDLFRLPGSPAAEAEAGGMLLLTLVAVGLAGLLRYALDPQFERLGKLRVPPRAGRIAVALAVVAALAAIVAADPIERFETFRAPPTEDELLLGEDRFLSTGGSGRYQFWEAAIDAFGEAPVGGQGSGGYGPYWLEHREYPLVATRAHSLIFESLAELGIAGFAVVVGFFATAAVAAVRRRRAMRWVPELGAAAAVLTVGVLAAAVDWTWDLPAVFASVVIAAALLVGPATLPAVADDSPRAPGGEARSRRRFAGGVLVLLVAWISICAAGLLLLADRSLESSREAAARGDLEAAIEEAASARDLEPWAAEPRTQLALLYFRGGDLTAARDELQNAIERSPRDFELYLLSASIEFTDGDMAAAKESLARAQALNPLDPLIEFEAYTE